jgi:hypothetical protein
MSLRFILAVAGWLGAGSALIVTNASENPYSPIVARNIFGLQPIPVHNPQDDVVVVPPPKITPNGIMTIFGKVQVLFKVSTASPGQPAKDVSYTMGVGERMDEITVQKIDEKAATITFENHGVIQKLELAKGGAVGAPAPGSPAGPGMIQRPTPMVAPGASSPPATVGFGGRFGRARNAAGGSTDSGAAVPGMTGGAGGAASSAGNAAPAEPISPEAQVIMMEAQRAKWLDEHNPAAAIMPPTAITKQVTGEEDPNSGQDANGGQNMMPGQ